MLGRADRHVDFAKRADNMQGMDDLVPGISSERRLGGLNSRPTRGVDIVAFVADGSLTKPARIPDPLARAAAATALA